jgi:CDP-paratose 2-epimerase
LKILVTGAAGFAGSNISRSILEHSCDVEILGFDNLSRSGSEMNVKLVEELGVRLIRGDARVQSDLDSMPTVDWVIDCAANPSVLAGLDGQVSSRQVMEHNLLGTINLLEYCKKHGAGLILLSTSRVYSAKELAQLPVHKKGDGFQLEKDYSETGISGKGISEVFPTSAPISLYGASKLTSETLILEYAEAFDFPVFINRCGVLAGAGQFGKADQGIFSYWLHSFREKKPLKYIGFGGTGLQVRDALHPKDLVPLLVRQMQEPDRDAPKIINLGGGVENSMSLKQLTSWCEERFGPNEVLASGEERPMDAPWIVMDSSLANQTWDWLPKTSLGGILEEIAVHAEKNPNWLTFCMS